MSASFILFIIAVIIIVAVASFRMGAKISKGNQQDAIKNPKSYAECVAENDTAFKYGSFTDARDGETYRTIQIGNQVWMAENLRFKADDSYAPNNNEENVMAYGRLYPWTTAMGIPAEFSEQSVAKDISILEKVQDKNFQGIAPEGWHIPSDQEWEQLMAEVKKTTKNVSAELRSACTWQNPGSDSFGFFALPAGYRFGNGNFCQFGSRARFWTRNEYGKTNAYRFSLTCETADIEGVYRTDALSIRCVKNA